MSSWETLERELEDWAAAGRAATFWWRDDDAVAPSAALTRLFALAQQRQAPLALAVIPTRATAALAEAVASLDDLVQPLQHGYAHENHAPVGDKKCELSDRRDPAALDGELSQGAATMANLFGARALPILVPPWNRIGPRAAGRLTVLGFQGLSTFGTDQAGGPRQVNCHLDILRWRPTRGFLGESEALDYLVAELGRRRTAEPGAPLGLLSHHLAHDEAAWLFLERLLALIADHPGAQVQSPAQCFSGVTKPG